MPNSLRIALLALGFTLIFMGLTCDADAWGDKEETPEPPKIVLVEMEHAWCYVKINKVITLGHIDTLHCIPKCNHPHRSSRIDRTDRGGIGR